MSETQQYRIPNQVRRDDFRAAAKPLLDLLGVSDEEIYDLHLSNDGVTFTMVAEFDGARAGVYPPAVPVKGPANEFAECGYFIHVGIV